MRWFAALAPFALSALIAAPAAAQDETLADIRQDLSVLFVEIQKLKRELSTTGGASAGVSDGSLLDRVNAIETELQRLTGKTEELEFRIGRVVEDGTNRVGDLEFRLCELEPDCDIGTLGDTPRLGGEAAAAAPAPAPQPTVPTDGPQLAVSERADFERASEALAQGDFRTAANQFAAFATTYPGSPLETRSHILRGDALAGLEDTRAAARAYLDAFSGAPDGQDAPEALLKLGTALGDLGQTDQACVTLREVDVRFPGAAQVDPARDALAALGCS